MCGCVRANLKPRIAWGRLTARQRERPRTTPSFQMYVRARQAVPCIPWSTEVFVCVRGRAIRVNVWISSLERNHYETDPAAAPLTRCPPP